MTKPRIVVFTLVLMMLALVLPTGIAAQTRGSNQAGKISALLPVAKIERGTGRTKQSVDAKKGDDVLWNDLVKTEKGGRARITLNDQSILSLGSQAELRIVSHDARSQQTALQLGYGRLRAQVASITRDGGKFELRTPTAVAGVIGTDFGTDAGIPGVTTFICITGVVSLANVDPSVPGQVPCPAGSTVDVAAGKTPGQPKPATPEQIKKLIEDTEPAQLNSMAPNSGGAGEVIEAVAKGVNMDKITGVGVAGAGVVAQITSAPTKDTVNVKITVAQNAEAGPRTVVFTQGDGKETAAVFTVLSAQEAAEAKKRKMPQPKLDGGDEHSFDVGAQAVLDGSKSRGSERSAVSAFKWELCDPQYKPTELGVPYDLEKNQGCHPIPNYVGTGSEFKFETCELVPQDYIVRLTLTDELQRTAAVDYKVRVLPETYPSPEEVLRGLAQSYEALQVNRFMDWFSEDYAGYTALSENIRRTFPTLTSMTINNRISQSLKRCNEATVRADWQQNFVLKDGACVVSSTPGVCRQDEQLTMRMVRTPGKYWRIVELSGDNGTVQGLPPGPNVDGGTFDIRLLGIQPSGTYIGTLNGVVLVDVDNRGPGSTGAGIFIQLRDSQNNVIGTSAQLPILSPNQTGQVPITFTVPNAPGAFGVTAFIQTHPINDIDATNEQTSSSITIVAPTVELAVTNLTLNAPAPYVSGFSNVPLSFSVTNSGTIASSFGLAYTCTLVSTGTTVNGVIPSIPATNTPVVINTPAMLLPSGVTGAQNITCNVTPNTTPVAESNNADNSTTSPLTMVAPVVDLQLTSITYTGGVPPFQSGQFRSFNLAVTNAGNAFSGPAGNTYTCNLLSTQPALQIATGAVPSVPAGGTSNIFVNFVVPANHVGANTISCTISQDPLEAAGTITDNTNTIAAAISLNIDLVITGVPAAPIAYQANSAQTLNFTVTNIGGDDAVAGWDVRLLINGVVITSQIGPALVGGASTPITFNYNVPSPGAAPIDVTRTQVLDVNNNGAVAGEINTNNIFSFGSPRFVDFTLTSVVAAGPVTAIQNRTFTFTNAVTVLPVTYPLPLTVNYTGIPAGINPSGTFGGDLIGLVTGAPGGYTLSPSATVSGITKTSANIPINVVADLSVTPGAAVNLTPAAGGGPFVNAVIPISGGVYPMNVSITAQPGITANLLSGAAQPGPGNITIGLSADLTAATGANFIPLTVVDNGTSHVPGKTVNVNVPYNVIAFVDLRTSSFTYDTAQPFLWGQNHTLTIPYTNAGNLPSSAANVLTCTLSGSFAPQVVINTPFGPSILPGQTITRTFNWTVPTGFTGSNNMTCVLSQDPLEPNANFTDNTNQAVVATLINPSGVVDNGVTVTNTTVAAPPYLSGQSIQFTYSVTNSGSVASQVLAFNCFFGSVNVLSTTIGPVNAGQTIGGVQNFAVPVNQAPSQNGSCTIANDPAEITFSNNTGTVGPIAVNPNFNLSVTAVSGPAIANVGSIQSLNATIHNAGPDTAPAGWTADIFINGAVFASFSPGTSILAGTDFGVSGGGANFVGIPGVNPAPTDQTFPTGLSATVVPTAGDTNAADNTLAVPIRIIDFTVTTNTAGPIGVIGRTFTAPNAVTVLPATMPATLLTYTGSGLPAGITAGGTFHGDLSGTPGGPAGVSITNPNLTFDGISKNGAVMSIDIRNEITLTPGALALAVGGGPQPLTINVAGGIYPVTLTLTLPTGINIDGSSPIATLSTIVAAPGAVTWHLNSDNTSVTGTGLTNITLNATDPGDGTITPPGNVNATVTYDNSASPATFNIVGVDNNGRLAPTGANAFQIGETPTPDFRVFINNSGGTTLAGNVDVQMTCSPSCPGEPFAVSIPAPGAGGGTSGTISFDTSALTPGINYQATFAIVNIPGGVTGSGVLSPVAFDTFDFTVTHTGPFTGQVQNVETLQVVPSEFTFSLNNVGPNKNLTGNATDGGHFSVPGGTSASLATPGNYQLQWVDGGSTSPGTADTITLTFDNFGVSKSITQAVKYYDAQIVQTTPGPGGSSGNPLVLVVGDTTGQSINFQLNGTFDTSSAPAVLQPIVPPGSGINVTLTSATPGNPGDTFTLQATTSAGAPVGVPTAVDITINIPNTNPQRTVQTQLWILPIDAPNLVVTNVAGTLGRQFDSSTPLIWGEFTSIDVTIDNIGTAPSSSNLTVILHQNTAGGPVLAFVNTVPSIAVGSPVTVSIPFLVPDPLSATANIVAEVVQDFAAGENDLSNNTGFVPVTTSDWQLQIVGSGTQGSPLAISGATGSSPAFQIQAVPVSGGSLLTDVAVAQIAPAAGGLVALSPTNNVLNTSNTHIAGFATNATNGQDGLYLITVLGQLPGGSKRNVGVYTSVSAAGGGAGTITITASTGNAAAGDDPGCSGPCVPLQVNGLLLEPISITATNSNGPTGTVDLSFTDDTQIVSVLDNGGNQLGTTIPALAYGSPVSFNVGALGINGGTSVTTGAAKVVISPSGITNAASRSFPIGPKIGTQQTTLYFNIGDINASPNSGCIVVPPGQTTNFDVNFAQLNGFNEPGFDYTWFNNNAGTVNLTLPADSSQTGYASLTNLQITNNEVVDKPTLQIEFTMIFNRTTPFAQSATKTFFFTIAPSSFGCGQASRSGGSSFATSNGIWRRGPAVSGGSSGASRAAVKAGAMPDLQIKSTDVSFSPSVPTRGDTVNVQFRMSNIGDAAASKVPVVLMANGQQVASDTFDVAAGSSTVGGLNWNTSNLQAAPARNVGGTGKIRVRDVSGAQRGGRITREEIDRSDVVATPQAQLLASDVKLVIDPAGTIKQKSAANKSVALTQLQIRPGVQTELARSGITPGGGIGEHVWVEVREMCIGLRMPSAASTNCEGTDLDLYVEDIGMGKYALSSMFGIADLGSSLTGDLAAAAKTASYTTRVNLLSGHAYAVQGTAGRVTVFTLSQVLSPSQFAELMKAKLGRTGRRITRNLGGETGATETGDVSGYDPSKAIVYFDLLLRPTAE